MTRTLQQDDMQDEAERVKQVLFIKPETRAWLWKIARRHRIRLGPALDMLAEAETPTLAERVERLEKALLERMPEIGELAAIHQAPEPVTGRHRYTDEDFARIVGLIPASGLTFNAWLRAAKALYPRMSPAVLSRMLRKLAEARTHTKIDGKITPIASVVDV